MTTISWTRGDDGSPGESWNPIRARLKPDSPLRRGHRRHSQLGWFCVPVHDGCTRCYAGAMNQWRGNGLAYKAQLLEHVDFLLDEEMLRAPLGWRKARRCFVCSMTDLYGPWVRPEWIDKIRAVQALTPHVTYIELTKRIERMRDELTGGEWYARVGFELAGLAGDIALGARAAERLSILQAAGQPLPNVWGGPSCSTQEHVDHDLPLLRATNMARRIVSLEPLLGPIDLYEHLLGFAESSPGVCACGHNHGFTRCPNTGGVAARCHKCACREFRRASSAGLHWVIAGLESGRGAREGYVSWINMLIAQCARARVPLFLKQLGLKPMLMINGKPRPLDLGNRRTDPKGEDAARWPESLRVQQFPDAPVIQPVPAAAAFLSQLGLPGVA